MIYFSSTTRGLWKVFSVLKQKTMKLLFPGEVVRRRCVCCNITIKKSHCFGRFSSVQTHLVLQKEKNLHDNGLSVANVVRVANNTLFRVKVIFILSPSNSCLVRGLFSRQCCKWNCGRVFKMEFLMRLMTCFCKNVLTFD